MSVYVIHSLIFSLLNLNSQISKAPVYVIYSLIFALQNLNSQKTKARISTLAARGRRTSKMITKVHPVYSTHGKPLGAEIELKRVVSLLISITALIFKCTDHSISFESSVFHSSCITFLYFS